MGGSVRKDMSCRITHLIAKEGGGDKYYYALTFRVPVVMDSWVYQAWENKHIVGFQASDTDFVSTIQINLSFSVFYYYYLLHLNNL